MHLPRIASITAGRYRLPLPGALSDSTHGTITAFALLTARLRYADGREGVACAYTTGHNGRAIHATLAHDIAEITAGADADLIEQIWTMVWWGLHYGGRGGPSVLALSALDIALWDLKARR